MEFGKRFSAQDLRPALAHADADHVTVIEPPTAWRQLGLRDFWRYRELLWMLACRDIKVRYRQTAVGVMWAVLQPLLTMIILSVVFGWLAGLGRRTDGVPYPAFVLAGLLPWFFFSNTVSQATASIANNAHLVAKVYFPRLIIPIALVGPNLVDLLVTLGLLLVALPVFGLPLGTHLLLLPVAIALLVVFAMGISSLLAGLAVLYRDFYFIVPLMLQLGLYATPIIYPPTMLPKALEWTLIVNPIAGLVGLFRYCLLGRSEFLSIASLSSSVAAAAVLLIVGIAFFRRHEDRFADLV